MSMYPLKNGIQEFSNLWNLTNFLSDFLVGSVRKQFYKEEMEFNWLNNCHFYNPIKTTDESFFNPLLCPLIIFVLLWRKKVEKNQRKNSSKRRKQQQTNKRINNSPISREKTFEFENAGRSCWLGFVLGI